jgi:hypothetical protein
VQDIPDTTQAEDVRHPDLACHGPDGRKRPLGLAALEDMITPDAVPPVLQLFQSGYLPINVLTPSDRGWQLVISAG